MRWRRSIMEWIIQNNFWDAVCFVFVSLAGSQPPELPRLTVNPNLFFLLPLLTRSRHCRRWWGRQRRPVVSQDPPSVDRNPLLAFALARAAGVAGFSSHSGASRTPARKEGAFWLSDVPTRVFTELWSLLPKQSRWVHATGLVARCPIPAATATAGEPQAQRSCSLQTPARGLGRCAAPSTRSRLGATSALPPRPRQC